MGWRSDRRWGEYELQEDERYIIIPVMSGIIDISQLNTPPEKHELATAKFFAERGKDIIFIPVVIYYF